MLVSMNRRQFFAASPWAAALPALAQTAPPQPAVARRRVCLIGHTGRGNFGHDLDKVWLKIPETEIAGVADADPAGLAKELTKLGLGTDRGFADYRAMLQALRPELVAVCPRHADQHRDMILAAIGAGARGIYVEKPLCRTPAEADEIRAACRTSGTKIAVAHRNRYHPVMDEIRHLIEGGNIGRVLEIRGRGKEDRRGGAEDLWVLGSHVLNLTQYFGGAPVSCSAVLLRDSRPVTAADVVEGGEGLGPLAGNEVHARFELASGVMGYFDSIASDGKNSLFGLQIIGTDGVIQVSCDRDPVAYFVPGSPFTPGKEARPWIPISSMGPGVEESPEAQAEVARVQNHLAPVTDLMAACDENRAPRCSLEEGALAVEMVCAVFESHRQGGRQLPIPLAERGNALAKLA